MDTKTISEHAHYRIIQSNDGAELFFDWKNIPGISIADFKSGVAEFARQCEVHKPKSAVIDATKLDQSSPAVAWVTGRQKFANEEDYMPWWVRDIIPKYNNAGIGTLAVATGNPNASGEVSEQPPGFNFRMGYFKDLGGAKQWSDSKRR